MAEQPSTALSFTQLLATLERGQTLSDLDKALTEVNAAVEETGKQGEITLKLKIAQMPNTDGQMVTVTPDVTEKAPKPPRKAGAFYKDEKDKLHTQDPRQENMRYEAGPRPVDTTGTKEA